MALSNRTPKVPEKIRLSKVYIMQHGLLTMQKAINSANIKGNWTPNAHGGSDFMHNSCIETVITVTGTEVTIWESMYANDFARITVDQD